MATRLNLREGILNSVSRHATQTRAENITHDPIYDSTGGIIDGSFWVGHVHLRNTAHGIN